MIIDCVNAWCNGDGTFAVEDERPDYWAPDHEWPPKNCGPCRSWNNTLGKNLGRPHMVVSCQNCLKRCHLTGNRQVWLKKRVGVPAPEIEAGNMCPDCLEASGAERQTRHADAEFLQRRTEANAKAREVVRASPAELRT